MGRAQKFGAFRIDVHSNDQVCPQIPRIAYGNVRHQSAIDQLAALSIGYRNVPAGDAATGPNRKREIAFAAHHYRLTGVEIRRYSNKRNAKVFKTRYR